MSNIEGDTSDLQTALDTLSVKRKDTITNAEVVEGQAVLYGVSLNKIGTKSKTVVIETSNKVSKLRVDKDKFQEKLIPGELPSESQTSAVLDGKKIRGLIGDRGSSLEPSANLVRVKGPPITDWSQGLTC